MGLLARDNPFFSADLTRKFYEMFKISYGPTTSQKAGYALECSSISAAIKLISKCIKGACNNFRSPLMKTQDRSVKMLGLELELFKLHSF